MVSRLPVVVRNSVRKLVCLAVKVSMHGQSRLCMNRKGYIQAINRN